MRTYYIYSRDLELLRAVMATSPAAALKAFNRGRIEKYRRDDVVIVAPVYKF